MSSIKRVTQLELEDFAVSHEIETGVESGAGIAPLSAQEVRQRSMAARQVLEARLDGGEDAGDWSEGYHRLINAGWPWRIAAYVAWASVPKAQRWPKTQNELATDVLGLTSDRVIATWRKKFPALDQMIGDLQADEMMSARGDVLHALKVSAATPDYKHSPDRRLFLTMTGDYSDVKSIGLPQKGKVDLRNLTDAELAALSGDDLKRIIAAMRDEAEADGDNL